MQIHSTRAGLDARLHAAEQGIAFAHEPQPEHADYAVKWAHVLIIKLLLALNEYFGWHLDLSSAVQDAQECWGNKRAPKSRLRA